MLPQYTADVLGDWLGRCQRPSQAPPERGRTGPAPPETMSMHLRNTLTRVTSPKGAKTLIFFTIFSIFSTYLALAGPNIAKKGPFFPKMDMRFIVNDSAIYYRYAWRLAREVLVLVRAQAETGAAWAIPISRSHMHTYRQGQPAPKGLKPKFFHIFFRSGTGPKGFARPRGSISRQKCRIWMRMCRVIAFFVVFDGFGKLQTPF